MTSCTISETPSDFLASEYAREAFRLSLIADVAWASARAEVASLARQHAAAENALRLLVGTEVAVVPGATFSAPPEIAVGLPSDVLLRRPDVLAAEQKLIAANANIGAARAHYAEQAQAATAASLFKALGGA
jgi:multidrug efflux system outer membrane protein